MSEVIKSLRSFLTRIGFYATIEDMHHHCPDTWERIIEDAREYRLNIGGSYLWKNKSDELIARCKALCKHVQRKNDMDDITLRVIVFTLAFFTGLIVGAEWDK